MIELQGYILCKILWPGGGEWCSGEQNEKEGKRGKEKEENDPLRGKLAAGEKYKN